MVSHNKLEVIRKLFCWLTISNFLYIIVLIILAGVSIKLVLGENGIITKTQTAKTENKKSQVSEEVNLAIGNLLIEENEREMTQEEKRQLLEEELKKQQSDSTVSINGRGFVASHRGYDVEIDEQYKVSVKEAFNAKEWDKTAASEDIFIWESDDPNDEEYGVLVGYTSNVQNYTILRYPSRCTKLSTDLKKYTYIENDGTTRIYLDNRNITSNIKKVELPETITEIGCWAFSGQSLGAYNFSSLTDIVLPKSVTSIGEQAFLFCEGLTSVTIQNGVTTIEEDVFAGCSNLTSINIPEGVTSIGGYAFDGCSSLASVIIPDSVTSIEKSAFKGCSSLTSIYIPSSMTTIYASTKSNSPFYNCSSTLKIYCGTSAKQSGWGTYWNYYSSSSKLDVQYNVTRDTYESTYK